MGSHDSFVDKSHLFGTINDSIDDRDRDPPISNEDNFLNHSAWTYSRLGGTNGIKAQNTHHKKETKKRKNPSNKKITIEPGEEIDELPYKRPSRRGLVNVLNLLKSQSNGTVPLNNSYTTKFFESSIDGGASSGASHSTKSSAKRGSEKYSPQISTRNLLASRRIIDTFNVGDVAGIQAIIEDTVTSDCDVCIFPLNQHLKGRNTLIDLWDSMLEAFPDGVFRASDTTINDRGELTTRFVFSGARQFNIVLGKETAGVEDTEIGEIVVPTDLRRTSGSESSSADSSRSGTPFGSSSWYGSTNHGHGCSSGGYETDTASLINNDANLLLNTAKTIKKGMPDYRPSMLLSLAGVASIGVDYSAPLIRSADLLVDDAAVEVYEGVMVMHTNNSYQISRLDYYWKMLKR